MEVIGEGIFLGRAIQTTRCLVLQEPKDIKLYREGTELTDSTTLAEAKAENGDTIAMAFALPGGAAPSHAVLL